MSFLRTASTASLALALSAPGAFADITGADVWADWKAYLENFGYETAGQETRLGDTLTVRDITMDIALPEDEGRVRITYGTITFTDNPDGTVSIGLPETMPITFNVAPERANAAQGSLMLRQSNPVMVVAGEANDFTYTYTVDTLGVDSLVLTVDGETVPEDAINVAMTISDLNTTTRTIVGDMRSFASTMTASRLGYELAFDDPTDAASGAVSFASVANNLEVSANGSFVAGVDSSDLGAQIASGARVTSSLRYENGNSRASFTDEGTSLSYTTMSGGGAFDTDMGPNGLVYDIAAQEIEIDALTSQFPMPVAITLAELGFNTALPLAESQEPQDFALGFKLGDFTISEAIWGLFDPGQQLPRDPATIELDLGGTARVLANILNPEEMQIAGAPGELNSLDIRTLLLSAAGAQLSGMGGFTFDNSDTATFNGFPRPEGAVDIRLEGANALIETLVSMGLLPQEQAMGARMMMGLFGVPQGDDVITSKIEVNGQGHVIANGQRLQ